MKKISKILLVTGIQNFESRMCSAAFANCSRNLWNEKRCWMLHKVSVIEWWWWSQVNKTRKNMFCYFFQTYKTFPEISLSRVWAVLPLCCSLVLSSHKQFIHSFWQFYAPLLALNKFEKRTKRISRLWESCEENLF